MSSTVLPFYCPSHCSKAWGHFWAKHWECYGGRIWQNLSMTCTLTTSLFTSWFHLVSMYHKSDDKPELVLPNQVLTLNFLKNVELSYSLWKKFPNSTFFQLSTWMEVMSNPHLFKLHCNIRELRVARFLLSFIPNKYLLIRGTYDRKISPVSTLNNYFLTWSTIQVFIYFRWT